jgi:hypothetical protein
MAMNSEKHLVLTRFASALDADAEAVGRVGRPRHADGAHGHVVHQVDRRRQGVVGARHVLARRRRVVVVEHPDHLLRRDAGAVRELLPMRRRRLLGARVAHRRRLAGGARVDRPAAKTSPSVSLVAFAVTFQ